jgi:hypothetical protein
MSHTDMHRLTENWQNVNKSTAGEENETNDTQGSALGKENLKIMNYIQKN